MSDVGGVLIGYNGPAATSPFRCIYLHTYGIQYVSIYVIYSEFYITKTNGRACVQAQAGVWTGRVSGTFLKKSSVDAG